jgi:hypothetical protein
MDSILQKIRFILLVCFSLLLTACSETIDYMVIGSGTPKGNEIAISDISFDNNSWGAIGGITSCCWGYATGRNGARNKPAPKTAYLEWYDYDQKIRYGGTMQLSDKLYDYATDLPNYRVIHSGRVERNPHPYFIFGFGEHGEVVAWISNSARGGHIEGRVMHEVGRIQAEVLSAPTTTTSDEYTQDLNTIRSD